MSFDWNNSISVWSWSYFVCTYFVWYSLNFLNLWRCFSSENRKVLSDYFLPQPSSPFLFFLTSYFYNFNIIPLAIICHKHCMLFYSFISLIFCFLIFVDGHYFVFIVNIFLMLNPLTCPCYCIFHSFNSIWMNTDSVDQFVLKFLNFSSRDFFISMNIT